MIAQRGSVQPDVRSKVGYHAPLELGIPQCALKISLDYIIDARVMLKSG